MSDDKTKDQAAAAAAAAAPRPPATDDPCEVLEEAVAASRSTKAGDFRSAVTAYERGLLEKALADCRHNQRRAAKALGLSYDQLRHAMKRHNLSAAPDAA